jgi:putative ABC transport system ATP-binding protein
VCSSDLIVKKPAIILADEPTANLDAENSHNVLQIMEELNQETGTTFIFATHDEKVISYLRRKITLIDGRVVRDEVMTPERQPEAKAQAQAQAQAQAKPSPGRTEQAEETGGPGGTGTRGGSGGRR